MRFNILQLPLVFLMLLGQTFVPRIVYANNMPVSAVIDDKDDAWTWNGAQEIADSNLSSGTGRALGPHGFGVCLFKGTGAALYGMSGASIVIDGKTVAIGTVKILVDGRLKDAVSLTAPDTDYAHKIFSINGLRNGNHVLEVRTVEGEAVIDYLKALTRDSTDDPIESVAHKANGPGYVDTFSSGAHDWVRYGGSHRVVDGHYVIEGAAGDKAIQEKLTFHDLAYSCDIAMSAGNDAGLIFRVTNPGMGTDTYNGYYVGLDRTNQKVILGRIANSWTQLAAAPFPVQPDMVYKLKIVAMGPRIAVSVNDGQVLTAEDATFPNGGIGIRVYNTTAAFSNLRVTAP